MLPPAVLFGQGESTFAGRARVPLRLIIPEAADRTLRSAIAEATAQASCAMLPMLRARGFARSATLSAECANTGGCCRISN